MFIVIQMTERFAANVNAASSTINSSTSVADSTFTSPSASTSSPSALSLSPAMHERPPSAACDYTVANALAALDFNKRSVAALQEKLKPKPAAAAEAKVPSRTISIHGVVLQAERFLDEEPGVYTEANKGVLYRGGEKYLCPIGWTEYRLAGVPDECFEWPTAFHGTLAKHLRSIVEIGLRKPGERAADGKLVTAPRYHVQIGDGRAQDGKDFASHVFVSPSIEYAERYAKPRHMHHGQEYAFVLKVRVRPGSFFKSGHTMAYYYGHERVSEHYRNSEIEWLVYNSQDVVVSSVMVKKRRKPKPHSHGHDYLRLKIRPLPAGECVIM